RLEPNSRRALSKPPRLLRAVKRSALAQVRALQDRGARARARARVRTAGHSGPPLGDGRRLPDRVPRGRLAARRAQKTELSATSRDEAVLSSSCMLKQDLRKRCDSCKTCCAFLLPPF